MPEVAHSRDHLDLGSGDNSGGRVCNEDYYFSPGNGRALEASFLPSREHFKVLLTYIDETIRQTESQAKRIREEAERHAEVAREKFLSD